MLDLSATSGTHDLNPSIEKLRKSTLNALNVTYPSPRMFPRSLVTGPFLGGGGVPQSQVLSQVSGLRSFPGGTLVLPQGMYPSSGWGYPSPSQVYPSPVCGVLGVVGYPPARTGLKLSPHQDRTGVPPRTGVGYLLRQNRRASGSSSLLLSCRMTFLLFFSLELLTLGFVGH